MKQRGMFVCGGAVSSVFVDCLAGASRFHPAGRGSLADPSTLDSLDMDELTYMMKEGDMIDDQLTVLKLGFIFTEVNSGAEEEGVDDDADELVYDEFLGVLAMICDAKVPESTRGGEPFEYTLHAWLQLRFLPVYKRLLKEKQRGLLKKVMN